MKPNPHIVRLIAEINARKPRKGDVLIALGLADPITGEPVSNAVMDARVAEARRYMEARQRRGAS